MGHWALGIGPKGHGDKEQLAIASGTSEADWRSHRLLRADR